MVKQLRWALLWALFILVLCALPGKDLPQWHWADALSVDKWVHAGMFGVLVTLLLRGARRHLGNAAMPVRWIWIIATSSIAYGGALEVMQGTLLIDRSADIADFIANSVGCGVGVWWWKTQGRSGKDRLNTLH